MKIKYLVLASFLTVSASAFANPIYTTTILFTKNVLSNPSLDVSNTHQMVVNSPTCTNINNYTLCTFYLEPLVDWTSLAKADVSISGTNSNGAQANCQFSFFYSDKPQQMEANRIQCTDGLAANGAQIAQNFNFKFSLSNSSSK